MMILLQFLMECESCVFLGLFFFCFNFKYNKYQVKPHKQKLFKTLNNFLEYKVIPELKCLKTAEIVYICIPNLCKAQARDLVSPGRLPSFYLGREKLSFPINGWIFFLVNPLCTWSAVSLVQQFLHSSRYKNHLESLLKLSSLRPIARNSDSVDLSWGSKNLHF